MVARPDPVLGEKTQAFIPDGEPMVFYRRESVNNFLRSYHLADYKVPDFIAFCGNRCRATPPANRYPPPAATGRPRS